MSQLDLAERIARKAHLHQLEPFTGHPYITHVERVVAGVEGETVKAVAWLHDVIEDTSVSAGDLLDAGVNPEVVESVQMLTRHPRMTYVDYIQRVQQSGLEAAIAVKRADLEDHLRDGPVSALTRSLRKRYEKAVDALLTNIHARV